MIITTSAAFCNYVVKLVSCGFPLLRPNVIGNVHLEALQYACCWISSCSHSDPYLTLESLPLLPTAVAAAAVATSSGATIRTDYLYYAHQATIAVVLVVANSLTMQPALLNDVERFFLRFSQVRFSVIIGAGCMSSLGHAGCSPFGLSFQR